MKKQFVSFNLDFFGFSASMLCAIHCAALPFLLTMAPLAGLQFLDNHWIEYAIILLSLVIATNSLVGSYRKHHKSFLALGIAIFGFALIGAGQVLEPEWREVVLTASGGAIVAIAHIVNWRLIKQSRSSLKTTAHQ